tara:strand:+ start:24729 stop:25100 length:372 start_codon:yes stop_codon:yes gene_type:complete
MKRPGGPHLLSTAGKVIEATLGELPPELREIAVEIPTILFEKVPQRMVREGLEPDTLGLFEGGDLAEEDGAGQARIYLFLENLYEYAQRDQQTFVEEVRVTFLHELGHLLALDEDDLLQRGLD